MLQVMVITIVLGFLVMELLVVDEAKHRPSQTGADLCG